MSYKETGHVHMDFHRTTNGTIAYLRKTYGEAYGLEISANQPQGTIVTLSIPVGERG